MFDTIESARKFAQDMAHKYHETFYIITWAPFTFEVVGARDMYYSKLREAEAVR